MHGRLLCTLILVYSVVVPKHFEEVLELGWYAPKFMVFFSQILQAVTSGGRMLVMLQATDPLMSYAHGVTHRAN